jgi:transcriptional/translational regulatory protein YebC/TACO1
MRHRWLRIAACAFAIGSVCGCGVEGSFARQKPVAPAQPDPAQDLSPITPLLQMMSSLPQGDPGRQAEIFQSAKDAADLAPTTSNRLRYALALATPGFSGTDDVAAQRQLAELLARPETLLPIERLLALVELKEVEQRLILQAENKRVRDDAQHDDSRDKLATANRRLAAESDENVRLRKALDEARAKLEAVTHIERSINDRGTSGSHTP